MASLSPPVFARLLRVESTLGKRCRDACRLGPQVSVEPIQCEPPGFFGCGFVVTGSREGRADSQPVDRAVGNWCNNGPQLIDPTSCKQGRVAMRSAFVSILNTACLSVRENKLTRVGSIKIGRDPP
jgi:hypothetical protein